VTGAERPAPPSGTTDGGRAGAWTDRDGAAVTAPEPPPAGSYYGPIGDFQGAAYDRNAFALGTEQEVEHLWAALGLAPGQRLVDVGCGTGRHVRALAQRGLAVVGVDLSHGLLAAGAAQVPDELPGSAAFVQADARALPLPDGCVAAALSLCQGGFGITPGGDERVLAELARVVRPGGRVALTAFSLAFAVRTLAPEDAIDLARGLVHTPAEVRGPDDERRHFDLWTACYTPGHLEALCRAAGLEVEQISGVEPGAYRDDQPSLSHPELLVIACRP
jgi:SAM-dependent methyltransferase